jgi:hypothetical protein
MAPDYQVGELGVALASTSIKRERLASLGVFMERTTGPGGSHIGHLLTSNTTWCAAVV